MIRRLLLSVLIPWLLVTACASQSESVAQPESPAEAVSEVVVIPTCEDFCGEEAELMGVLASDGESCLWLDPIGNEGEPRNAVWPQGFSAHIAAHGQAELLDASGEVIAREGDRLTMSGGSYDAEVPGCAPGADADRQSRVRSVDDVSSSGG